MKVCVCGHGGSTVPLAWKEGGKASLHPETIMVGVRPLAQLVRKAGTLPQKSSVEACEGLPSSLTLWLLTRWNLGLEPKLMSSYSSFCWEAM